MLDDHELDLGARAFDLLVALVESRHRVMTKRELLAVVWPGSVVEENALHAQVSLLRKKLGRHVVATVTGRGYRFVDRLTRGDGAGPAPHNGLPTPVTRFVGREQALGQCLGLLDRRAPLTITGMGGAGKTRLAIEIARARHAQGATAWFADLSGVGVGDRVVAAVAAAVGARERADEPLLDTLSRHFSAEAGVLVLDNCEHVTEAVAQAVRVWSTLHGTLQIVATSRQPLRVPGEQIYALAALTLPASREPDDVLRAESVQLFADRASLHDPQFDVVAAGAGDVADICERLDGIPLAIELAAARTRLLTVRQLSERLDARLRLLVGGTSDVARQQTLRASMQWSYELLDASEQKCFRELAVFVGGCTLDSARVVLGAADDYEALEALTSLYDKSLIVVERNGDALPRYTMLQIVREFANEALEGAPDSRATDRHLAHYVGLAEQLVPRAQPALDGSTLGRLRREEANFRVAMARCERVEGGTRLALRLAGSLWPYWLATSQLALGEAFTTQALGIAAAPAEAGDEARARTLLGLGNVVFYRGRYAEALSIAQEALARARATGDQATAGFALKLLAGAHHALGQPEAALTHYRDTLAVAVAIGDAALQSAAQNNLAEVHRGLGDLAEAEAAYRLAIEIGQAARTANVAMVMCNLARLRLMQGEARDAVLALLDAQTMAMLTSYRSAGDQVIDIAAALASRSGRHAAAACFNGASLARMSESGSRREPLDEAFIEPWVAQSRAALGEAAFAAEHDRGLALDYEAAMAEVGDFLRRHIADERAEL